MSAEFKLLDNLPEAIRVIDKDLRSLYANNAAKRQDGISGGDVIGQLIQDVFSGADTSELVLVLKKCINEGQVSDMQIETHPSGLGIYYFQLHIQPIDHGAMLLTKDITEQINLEKSLMPHGATYVSLLAGMTENLLVHKVINDKTGKPVDLQPVDIALAKNGIFTEAKRELAANVKTELLDAIRTEHSDLVNRVVYLHESVVLERFISSLGKWFEIYIFSPIVGQIASLVIDINERKMAEEKIKKANVELEDRVKGRTQELINALEREKGLNDLKSNFVSIASHEFRTPLTAILSSIRLIETYLATGDTGNCQRHILRIKNSVTSLTEILDDILTVEKLERGKLLPKMELFNLPKFVQNLVDELAPISKTNQRIIYAHTGTLNILSDKSILKNTLQNLLSNAIKYSESNIRISSSIEGQTAVLIISDRGIGIPEKDQQNIFGRFFRATNIGSIPGTGLGLNIAKHYVDLLDGAISFESVEKEGTTFTIRLPQVI